MRLLRQRLDQRGAIVLARLDDLHQRRPAERRHAEEAAAEGGARLAVERIADRRPQNMKAPETAHSPGSAARSNTNVSDGSSRMVRKSFTTAAGPPVAGSSHDGAASARQAASRRSAVEPVPMRRTSRSPFSSMSRRTPTLRAAKPREIVLRDLAKALLLPSIDRDHQMARKALDQAAGAEIVEALLFERRRQRPQPRLVLAHRDGADHGAEHQPCRRLVLVGAIAARRAAPPPTSPPSTRSRPASRS